MGRQFNRVLLSGFVASTLVISGIGCTRAVDENLSLKIQVPTSLSSLTANQQLLRVTVNLRKTINDPDPIEIIQDFDQFGPTAGSAITIAIPGSKVPRSPTLFVQYIGIFGGDGAGMSFTYGFTTVNSDINGPIVANIVAAAFGSSGAFGRVSGHYEKLTGPEIVDYQNDTGVVYQYFRPPVATHPDLIVDKSEMFDGWFNVISLAGVPMKYILQPNSAITASDYRVLFEAGVDLNDFASADDFDGEPAAEDNFFLTGNLTAIARITIPPSFRKEYYGFGSPPVVRQEAKNVFVMGFFDGLGGQTSANAVRLPTTSMPLPGLYLDSQVSAPIRFTNSGPTAVEAYADTTLATTTINHNAPPNSIYMAPNLEWAKEGHDSLAGFRGPFAALNYKTDFSGHAQYLRATYDNDSGPNLLLKWNFLPGTNTGLDRSVDGVMIYVKRDMGGGGYSGGGNDELSPCNQRAFEDGFNYETPIDHTTTNTNYSYVDSGNGNFEFDYYQYRFMLCPYKDLGGGEKMYYAAYAETQCSGGNCADPFHLGLGDPGATVPSMAGLPFGYATAQLMSVTPPAALDDLTTVSVSTTINFATGDEVMIRIVGQSPVIGCGQVAPTDQVLLTRLVTTSGANFQIPRGSWVDDIDIDVANTDPAADEYCIVQMTKVLHFGSGTVTGTVSPSGFDPATPGIDGLLAMRFSGTLTFTGTGSKIDVSGKGFSANQGADGDSSVVTNHSGGMPGSSTPFSIGGGGGGHNQMGGNGGNGSNTGSNPGDGGLATNFYGPLYVGFGGGGGVGSSGMSTTPEGSGGGAIFLVANRIDNQNTVTGTPLLLAKGVAGRSMTSGDDSGNGGGAGGSITLFVQNIVTGTSPTRFPIRYSVSGGAGGNGFTNGSGGGGGSDGIASTFYCDQTSLDLISMTVRALAGTGVGTGADGGQAPPLFAAADDYIGICPTIAVGN